MPRAGPEADGEIEPFGSEVDTVVVGRKPDFHEGMALAKSRKARQKPADGEGADHTDRQDFPHMSAPEPLHDVGHAIETVAQHRQQALALRRDHQPARQPLEEHDVQLLLQALHLMADRRLRHVQLDGSAREGEMARRRLEGAEGVQRQIGPNHGNAPIFLMAETSIDLLSRHQIIAIQNAQVIQNSRKP